MRTKGSQFFVNGIEVPKVPVVNKLICEVDYHNLPFKDGNRWSVVVGNPNISSPWAIDYCTYPTKPTKRQLRKLKRMYR